MESQCHQMWTLKSNPSYLLAVTCQGPEGHSCCWSQPQRRRLDLQLSPPSPTRHPGETMLHGFWRVAAPVEHEASVWKLPQIHPQSQIPPRSISHSAPGVTSADLPTRSCWHCLGCFTGYTGLLLQLNNSICLCLPLGCEDPLEKGLATHSSILGLPWCLRW